MRLARIAMKSFSAAITALIYAVFSVLWIFTSDAYVFYFVSDLDSPIFQLIKGLTFVTVSSLLIFYLMRRALIRQQRLHDRLAGAEHHLRAFAENSLDLFFVYQLVPDRKFTYVSPSCLRLTGYSQLEHYRDPDLVVKIIHPDDRALFAKLTEETESQKPVVLRWKRRDGGIFYMEQRNAVHRDAHGTIISISGIAREVTDREIARHNLENLNEAYATLWQVNRLIGKKHSEQEIFQEACAIPMASSDFPLIWIGRVNLEANTVVPVASAGEQIEYLQDIHITIDDTPSGRGPTGLAARLAQSSYSSDIATDAQMTPWRDRALSRGFRSSASFPLFVDNKVYAVWTLYSAKLNYFNQTTQALYGQLAADISHALQGVKNERERSRLAEEVRISEERMRLDSAVIRNTRDGVVITDLTPKIVAINRAFTEITGYTEAEVLGKNPSIIKSGKQSRDFYEKFWEELLHKGQWQGELYNRRKNGEIYPQLASIDTISDDNGKPQYYVGVFTDISKLKESEENFEKLAHYDILTGLPNRLMLTGRLAHALETARRKESRVALLFMDLDHFKNVNDVLGHPAGDELLQMVGQRLRHRLREEDTVGRLGGDEFLILVEDLATPNVAAKIANDLMHILSEPFRLTNGHEVYAAASVGISLYPEDGDTTADLIRNADAALYLAKSEGRSTFRFYTNALTATAHRRLELELQLRRAIAASEISVHYQPITDMTTGKVCGAEALCRWTTAGGNVISPAEFIPIAEDTGLIIPLGERVLTDACGIAARWHEKNAGFKTMAVNVSVRQFQRSDWYERFKEILANSGLAPGLLEVEITESGLMSRGAEALNLLALLRNSGVRIAIDDFGTGYSSLSYLQRFAVHKLKIDQSFISGVPADKAAGQIVRTVAAMGTSLGLTVLAEGVETAEQLEFLRSCHCDQYQGYLKGKPVPAEEFERLYL